MESDRRDRGFSLVELLVVIVVLGILATVTVFAVRGLADRGETTTCAGDRRIVISAMEVHFADRGNYTDEATLATEGFLRSTSNLHDVSLTSNDYTIVPVGACAAGTATTMASGTGPTTTATVPSPVVSFTVAGFPAEQRGDGTGDVALFFGAGTAAADLAADAWADFQSFALTDGDTAIWVDLRSAGDAVTLAQIIALVPVVDPDLIAMQQSGAIVPLEFVAYLVLDSTYNLPACWVAPGAPLEDCSPIP